MPKKGKPRRWEVPGLQSGGTTGVIPRTKLEQSQLRGCNDRATGAQKEAPVRLLKGPEPSLCREFS